MRAPGSEQRRNVVPVQRLARLVLTSFLLTFLLARITVFCIETRRLPDLYLFLGGTHIHHLNYGIFLLVASGAYLLFRQPEGRHRSAAALIYGVGLGLTFDEFGMWLHLSGEYWQRASFDAVVVIAAVLGLIGVAPAIRQLRPTQWTMAVILLLALVVFGVLSAERYAGRVIVPRMQAIEQAGPPQTRPARAPATKPAAPRVP